MQSNTDAGVAWTHDSHDSHDSRDSHDSHDSTARAHSIPVRGALLPYVSTLMAVELEATGPLALAVVPHESLVLSVQLGRGPDSIDQKGQHGELTHLTGIREWTGSFKGAGDCITLFALLTPLDRKSVV